MHHLGIYAKAQGLSGAGQWWHFGANEDLLRRYRPHAHVPIRHPLSVARSWAQQGKTGKPMESMLKGYRCMFEYIAEHDCTFYRMEDLPRLAGTDDHPDAPDESLKITQYQNAVTEHVIEPHREFFARFYRDLESDSLATEKVEA